MSTTRINDGKHTLKVNDDLSINVKVSNFNEFDSQSDGATETKQDLQIVKLSNIEDKLPDLGQATMSNSSPVTIASNQSAIPVTVNSSLLPLNASTESKQDNQITQTVNLVTNLGSRADIQATDSTSTWSLISLIKRATSFLESVYINTLSIISNIGNTSDVKATSETGSFSLNSLLKRISYNTKADYDKASLGKYSSDILTFVVNGHNTNVVTTTTNNQDVWTGGLLYTGFPNVASIIQVFSSSTLDTLLGTGARTVRISGLDVNYNQITEVINLNGITSVSSVLSYLRVSQVLVLTAGVTSTNQGVITCGHIAPNATNVFCRIPAFNGVSQATCLTIPSGYTGILKSFRASLQTNAVVTTNVYSLIFLKTILNGVISRRLKRSISTNSSFDTNFETGMVFPERTDLIVSIEASTSNCQIIANYEVICYKNTLL